MKRFSDRHSLTTLSELNVTPLLDLAFVLLIIFIITTPLMDNSMDLVVPSSQAAKDSVNPSEVQTIAINRQAMLTLNQEPVAMETLGSQLQALKATKGELAVVIRADKELPVQKLIEVMDAVKQAQITKVGVVTNPAKE